MAKTRVQKDQELQTLAEKFSQSKGVVFLQYLGLKVNDLQSLRRALRKEENELVVAKKSLIGLMLEKAGLAKAKIKEMSGGVAVAFGYKDEVSPAKVVANFAKEHAVVTFFGGILEGAYVDAAKVTALSKLPSRQELLGRMVGSIKQPVSGLVNVLSGNMRGLMQVLNQIKDQKDQKSPQ